LKKLGINKYFWPIVFLFIFSFLSGSKGSLLKIALLVLFVYTGVKKSSLQNIKLFINIKVLSTLMLLFALTILSISIFYNDFDPLNYFLISLYERGDIYYLSFVTNDISNYFEKYNFFLYHLHHFLKLLTLKGYDVPLGTALYADFHGIPYNEITGGPNNHLPVLSLVLTKGNLYIASIYCFLQGILVTISRLALIRVMCYSYNPFITLIIGYYGLFYFNIVLDFGVWSYNFVSICILSFIYYILHRIILIPKGSIII